MKLPERYNYLEAYLTFRCNYSCDYCINGETEKNGELSAKEWLKLNDLQLFKRGNQTEIPITLGGGEPTLHKEFYEIVNGLNHPLDLLTNLNFDVDEFIEKVSPTKFSTSDIEFYHPIRASFHPSQGNPLKNAKKLRENGFNVAIFGINHPYQINDNMKMAFEAQKLGVPFYTKDFLGKIGNQTFGYYKYPEGIDGVKKEALCRTRELLISPTGDVYRCHRDLYRAENPISNLSDLKIRDTFKYCKNYGECNPCDVKAKTNRYLNGIDCQVQIRDLR